MLEVLTIVLGGLVLGVMAVVFVGVARVRALRRRHREHVAAVQPEHSVQATLFGIASEGKTQARGLGTLVLGPTHLAFVQLLPERVVSIGRDDITSTSASRHFLGKTQGRDLLVVTWGAEGMGDAAAFDVPDVAAWRGRLSS